MNLSIEQQIAFDKYVSGENIFITGPGGTGKSALIRQIYSHSIHYKKNICVTALTGCAAVLLNCNAKTLHSWAGIGLGNDTIENILSRLKKNKFATNVWLKTEVLVIDEVSMLSLKLFELLNEIGQLIRRNRNAPFGGIQLIFSGDFFQLPPVGDNSDPDSQSFCFESNYWSTTFSLCNQICLVKIFRQTDEIYCSILNQIREGKIKRKSNDILLKYVNREKDPSMIIEPTKLFPIRSKVDIINKFKMSKLKGEEREYELKQLIDNVITKSETKTETKSETIFSTKEIEMEMTFLSNSLICDKLLKIKIGAQVMCIINISSTIDDSILLSNGSQGIVIGFCEVSGCPRVRFNNGVERVMNYYTWVSNKIPYISVSQVPLILAWALTIHKSQGATLDAAEIDVGNDIFECGQTYVALSRVKSLNGLYLSSYDPTKIRIYKKVKDYYLGLL